MDQLRACADFDGLIDSFTARARAAQLTRPERFRADVMVIDSQSTLRVPPPASYQITQSCRAIWTWKPD